MNGSAILLGSSYESSRESKFDRLFGSGSGRGASLANASYNEETFEEDDDAGYSSSLGNKMKRLGTGTRGRRDSSTSTIATAGTSPASNTTVGLDGNSEYSASYKAAGKVGKVSKEKDLLRCEMCHKVYHHPQSLIKRGCARALSREFKLMKCSCRSLAAYRTMACSFFARHEQASNRSSARSSYYPCKSRSFASLA